MGAAYDPTRRHIERGPRRILAGRNAGHLRPRRRRTPTPGSRRWRPCPPGSCGRCGRFPPRSPTPGSAIPSHNVTPVPDYTRICVGGGIDNSPACLEAVLRRHQPRPCPGGDPPHGAAPGLRPVEHSRSALRRRQPRAGGPWAPGLRRPDDGARPQCAGRGGRRQRPTRPGPAYDLDDAEWAGGSSNGLDAVYGWMYDDGFDSGNLDCLHRGRRRLLGPPQGHPRRLRVRAQPGHGCRRRHARATRTAATKAARPWRSRWPSPARRHGVHLQLGGGGCRAPAWSDLTGAP